MKGPLFLRLNEIIEIHSDQIARYGGSRGIRDLGLLQSAVAMPMSGFGGQFLHSDLYEMAAASIRRHTRSRLPSLQRLRWLRTMICWNTSAVITKRTCRASNRDQPRMARMTRWSRPSASSGPSAAIKVPEPSRQMSSRSVDRLPSPSCSDFGNYRLHPAAEASPVIRVSSWK